MPARKRSRSGAASKTAVRPLPQPDLVGSIAYPLLLVSLLITGVAFGSVIVLFINGVNDIAAQAVPLGLLVIGLPVTGYLMYNTARREARQPGLRHSWAKRLSAQIGQIMSFIAGLLAAAALVSALLLQLGNSGFSLLHAVLDAGCVFLTATAIFVYYWSDNGEGEA